MTGVSPVEPSTSERSAAPGPAGARPGAVSAPAPVVLRFAPMAEHVRTARLIAVALARRAGVEDGLLDEVRLAVGEACSRAVGLHRAMPDPQPVVVRLDDSAGRFGVEVLDVIATTPAAAGAPAKPQDPMDADAADEVGGEMGLAVLAGLVEDLDVSLTEQGGLIRMRWPATPHFE
jgi:anti-sigma regulatory factor (Ser/Thr protein kinase)